MLGIGTAWLAAGHREPARPDRRRRQARMQRKHPSETRPHSMADIAIRPLNEKDALDFQNLRLRVLREHPDACISTYERKSAYSLGFVAERLRLTAEAPDNFTFGAHFQEELIGVVGFIRMPGKKEQHRGEIWGMYVRSEEQGKGTGRSLLTKAVELARSLPGLEQIELGVVTRNRQARNLYVSLGFVSFGIDPSVFCLHGEYLDEERMVLFLKRR